MTKKLKNEINWPALSAVLFNVVPDSTFNIGSGITTITPNLVSLLWGMPADSLEANRILYPEKTVVNPHIGLNTIIYNPNANNRDAVSLDALHVMHDSPIYLELYKQYVESLPQGFEPLMEAANDEFGNLGVTVIEKYLKGLPLSLEELEVIEPIYDALLRRQFAPDYMRNVPHGYQDKAILPTIPSINISGDEAIRRYMESYPLKEVTITPENKHGDGGPLHPDWNALSMKDRAAYIRMGVANGYRDINSIRLVYNEFRKGGPKKKKDPNILKLEFLNNLELSLEGYSRYATPEWKRLLTELAFKESSYYPNVTNSIGAKGYFQLMPFNRSSTWSTPILLFHEMYKLTDANMKYLKNTLTEKDLKKALSMGIDIYGLIAGAHLGGVDNAIKALRGLGNAKDMNNSSVFGYMKLFSLMHKLPVILDSNKVYIEPIIELPDATRVSPIINTLIELSIPVKLDSIDYEQSVPEVIVTPDKPKYIIPDDEVISLIQSLIKPLTLAELPKPFTATERLKEINNNRVTLLLKDLEDSIIRNNLLDIQNPDKLRKDAEDLRFYRNMSALGGNLFPKGGPMIKVNPGDRVFTDLCALWSNSLLRDNGYLINGNAWNLGNVDLLYNGFEELDRPENYDSRIIADYNHKAADNVFKNFDSKTLDTSKPYVVNMFYNNSPSLEEAYNNGKGVTGTHTGLLTYDEPTKKWWVTHNIHGNIHLEPFIDLQNSKGKYGVTAIYAPRKNTLWNRTKGFFGFSDGGYLNTIQ